MIAEILGRIAAGVTTIAQLAGEVGVDKETLVQRLLMMERMGYVVRISPEAPACAPTEGCRGCACHGACPRPGESGPVFGVTKKGEAVIARTAAASRRA